MEHRRHSDRRADPCRSGVEESPKQAKQARGGWRILIERPLMFPTALARSAGRRRPPWSSWPRRWSSRTSPRRGRSRRWPTTRRTETRGVLGPGGASRVVRRVRSDLLGEFLRLWDRPVRVWSRYRAVFMAPPASPGRPRPPCPRPTLGGRAPEWMGRLAVAAPRPKRSEIFEGGSSLGLRPDQRDPRSSREEVVLGCAPTGPQSLGIELTSHARLASGPPSAQDCVPSSHESGGPSHGTSRAPRRIRLWEHGK